ncbi:putative Deformed epidermal autoregulatory factor 1 [Hypsibius exemplaris]|uniref:Deformed epidermal autoregulatory factor 1 n=1 Tax=Hypsibius exemplaris TaxID=2072580 RepID=A0A1W0WBR5_HYPEX|nr:putative Deformed epidermal autoregulatory factor 1 [Hypsibius exemplaris]
MLHHMGMPPRYSMVGAAAAPPGPNPPNNAARMSASLMSAMSGGPAAAANSVFSQAAAASMYLGMAQRESMLRTVFAGDYLKPQFTVDGETLLDVECGENRGMLYLSRFCQGSKGPCIRFDDMWLTPNEFQYISGRESAKDWKRSIRHQGKSLKLLLAKGILTVHQSSCSCTGCRISSPVNRGKLANCNPRFGYDSMFDFSEKPLPHLFGNYQTVHHQPSDPEADENPLSPNNPSHSSKESSDFSSGESRTYRSTFSGMPDQTKAQKSADYVYDRKMPYSGTPIATPPRMFPGGSMSAKGFTPFPQQPAVMADLAASKLEHHHRERNSYPVCKPIAQMFSGGVSSSRSAELMQSMLQRSNTVAAGPAISTQTSAFYPFNLNLSAPTKTQSRTASSPESSNTSTSPISSVHRESPASATAAENTRSKSPEPLDLSTTKCGGKVARSGRITSLIKPSNPPPREECRSAYAGSRGADKTPYSRPTTTTAASHESGSKLYEGRNLKVIRPTMVEEAQHDEQSMRTKNEPSVGTKNEPSVRTKNEPSGRTKNEPSVRTKNEPSVRTNNELSVGTKNEPSVGTKNEPSVGTNESSEQLSVWLDSAAAIAERESETEEDVTMSGEDEEEDEEEEEMEDEDDRSEGSDASDMKNSIGLDWIGLDLEIPMEDGFGKSNGLDWIWKFQWRMDVDIPMEDGFGNSNGRWIWKLQWVGLDLEIPMEDGFGNSNGLD